MHGARSGAPRGNKNALKHGYYAAEAVEQRKTVSELLRLSREIIDSIC
jgi:hypothetical protein